MRIKTAVKSYVMVIMVPVWATSPALTDDGPLQTINRFRLHHIYLKTRPVKANLPAKAEVDINLDVRYINSSPRVGTGIFEGRWEIKSG